MRFLSSTFLRRFAALAACALCLPALLAAKNKSFVKPVAQAATNYPAHDFHRDEKLAMAADPYDTPEKAKIFSIDFAGHGFLPVFFVVTNDGDKPISIANIEITLITENRCEADADLSRRYLPATLESTRPDAAEPDSDSPSAQEGGDYAEGNGGDRIVTVRRQSD